MVSTSPSQGLAPFGFSPRVATIRATLSSLNTNVGIIKKLSRRDPPSPPGCPPPSPRDNRKEESYAQILSSFEPSSSEPSPLDNDVNGAIFS